MLKASHPTFDVFPFTDLSDKVLTPPSSSHAVVFFAFSVCVFGVVQRILHRAKLVTLFSSSGGSIGFFVGWLFVKVVLTREEWREKCVYWKISAF